MPAFSQALLKRRMATSNGSFSLTRTDGIELAHYLVIRRTAQCTGRRSILQNQFVPIPCSPPTPAPFPSFEARVGTRRCLPGRRVGHARPLRRLATTFEARVGARHASPASAQARNAGRPRRARGPECPGIGSVACGGNNRYSRFERFVGEACLAPTKWCQSRPTTPRTAGLYCPFHAQ